MQKPKKPKKGKKKKMKKMKARLKLMKERIRQVQMLFSIGVVLELLTINYFKAILAYVLRFRCNLNENQAIMTYHLFQGVSYTTAFVFGIIMTYSPKATIITMNLLYLGGSGSIIFALMGMPAKPNLIPFIPYAVAAFGIGHGAYKAVVPKVLNAKKSSHVFVSVSLIEMFLEFILVGVASLILVGLEIYIFLGLLGLTILVVLVSSFQPMSDPKHMTEKTFKYVNVFNCSMYGLFKLLVFHVKKWGKFKDKHEKNPPAHWLERCIKKYGQDLVDAMIIKYTLHKFYIVVAGLWIGVEMKYSYWIFASYLTNRIVGTMVLQPSQFLGIPPLVGFILLPTFVYFLGPAMSKSYYNTGTRQMCLGAWFILCSTALSWQLSSKLAEVSTQFMEPDFSHTNIRIINGHFCPSSIVYYFPMDLEEAAVRYPRQALDIRFTTAVGAQLTQGEMPKSAKLDTKVNIITPLNKDTFLKYANLPTESAVVGEVTNEVRTPTDSFTYLMHSLERYDQTLAMVSYGYCETLASKYVLNIPLNLPRQPIGHVDVYLMCLSNDKKHFIHFPHMDYGRSPHLKPGARFYVLYKGKPEAVTLAKNHVSILSIGPQIMDSGVPEPSKIIWLEVGDGPNLVVFAGKISVTLNYTLGPGEMVDFIVYVQTSEQKVELSVKTLYMQPPLTISGWAPFGQYLACSIGEFLLGVIGLQYLIEHAPHRMQYFVFMDWYLMLGFANFVILTISQMPSLFVYHVQYSVLTLIVGTCFFFIIVMASRF